MRALPIYEYFDAGCPYMVIFMRAPSSTDLFALLLHKLNIKIKNRLIAATCPRYTFSYE